MNAGISRSVRVVVVMLAIIVGPALAAADTVVLNNGARLIGTVENADGKQLTLKTDYAGDLKIKWPQIRELSTDQPVFVVTPDNRTINGTVSTEGENLVVHTRGGEVPVPLAKVAAMRSPQQQQSYEAGL